MIRRRFLFGACAALALSSGAAQAKMSLDQLSAYINDISTLEAAFVQINSDGSLDNGTLYLRRPGRLRFEYETHDALVLAGGGKLAIFDPKTNVPPEQYPLKRTPLHLILQRKVDLAASGMVVGHSGDDDRTIVVAQDPDSPESGVIELVFQNNPLTLAEWTIDQNGARTTIDLEQIKLGGRLGASLFNIVQETEARLKN